MNKLMCWGILGAVLVVGSYKVLRNARESVSAPTGDGPIAAGCCAACSGCCSNSDAAGADMDDSANTARTTCGGRLVLPMPRPAEDECRPSRQNYVIELQSSSTAAPPAIFLPDSLESPPPLPAVDALSDLAQSTGVVPLLMPYCDDDESGLPKTMPYADNEIWRTVGAAAGTIAGWFEDSEPATREAIPTCREDENLSHQYPACPALDGGCPAGKQRVKRSMPWRHDTEPILPVGPDLPGQTAPVRENSNAAGPQAWRGPSGFLRHTVLKVLSGKNADAPARQPVDTLEMRPSDLRHDEVAPDNF
jgi:hypothetical protein